MSAASTRMMLVDTRHDQIAESESSALAQLLDASDLLVVNDAATLPASLFARSERGDRVEIRLLDGPYEDVTRAVLFGQGDYRLKTEERPAPPPFEAGEPIYVGAAKLIVETVSPLSPRLVELRWPGERSERFALLYRAGRPIQYSYVPEPLALWDVQTVFATRPWAVEMPSAARPLRAETLLALAQRGIPLSTLTHSAGLSATGDAAIDAALPLPERYDIPRETVEAVRRTKERGGRIVAVGTTVVRALEDSVRQHGELRAGEAVARLVLGPETPLHVVTGLLTGIHMPGESHYRLLSAFAAPETLARSAAFAEAHGYRVHEFGDAALFLPEIVRTAQRAA